MNYTHREGGGGGIECELDKDLKILAYCTFGLFVPYTYKAEFQLS